MTENAERQPLPGSSNSMREIILGTAIANLITAFILFLAPCQPRVPQLMSSSSTRIGGLTCENAAVEVRCVCY